MQTLEPLPIDNRSVGPALDGPALVAAHLPSIDRAIASVCRRQRLTREAGQELASDVYLRVLRNDAAALRAFRGESSLSTFLVVLVQRVLLDARIAKAGKWRPSTCARRLGRVAIDLERLVYFDGRPFVEAAELLRQQRGVTHTDDELRFLLMLLPARCRRRVIGDCDLEQVWDGAADPEARLVDVLPSPRRAAVARALAGLPRDDRRLLGLRFVKGERLCEIARRSGVDERQIYRRFERLLDTIRSEVAPCGRSRAAGGWPRRPSCNNHQPSAFPVQRRLAQEPRCRTKPPSN